MKIVTLSELEAFFAEMAREYDVRVPVRLPDGTRILGRPGEGPLALEGTPVARRPSELFFPQHDSVFTVHEGKAPEPPPSPARPLIVVGLGPADLDALAFVDTFFAAGLRDDLYFARRDGALIVGLSDSENRAQLAGLCDLELIAEGERFGIAAHTEGGSALESRMRETESNHFPLLAQGPPPPDGEVRQILQRASALLLSGGVPDHFWEEIAARCIACTGCTLVCPTCTCFDMQDRRYPDRLERSRQWDSCQFDAFAREASGHNPLGTEGARTRRRIHHKLAADVRRWGRITCVGCGRCENACPTGIGLISVAREMVERFG
jgi:sulfhydrogenase subunit beta (sulfur reductase)